MSPRTSHDLPSRGSPSSAGEDTRGSDTPFEVVLQRSARRLLVPSDKSILEVLLDAGVDVDYSCTEGICGTCISRVLAGIPEHRDHVLSERERVTNDRMAICCSRAVSPELTLDL